MQLFEDIKIEYKNESDRFLKPLVAFRQEVGEYDDAMEVFQIRFDYQQQMIGSCYLDGSLRVHSLEEKREMRRIESNKDECPVTCIRYRPNSYDSRCKRVLVSGGSDGELIHWHVNSGKQLNRSIEVDNQILSMDYTTNGQWLATGGKDCKIRIYDESIKRVEQVLQAKYQERGHTNRIFSIKFVDQNVLISGGWDNSVLFWDRRVGKTIGHVFGTNLSGDSLDIKDDHLIVGNYRNQQQLQLYSFKEQRLIQNIEYTFKSEQQSNHNIHIYSTQISNYANGQYVIIGASGDGQVRLFDSHDNYNCIAKITGFQKGCYTVDTTKNGYLGFGTANGEIYVFKHVLR